MSTPRLLDFRAAYDDAHTRDDFARMEQLDIAWDQAVDKLEAGGRDYGDEAIAREAMSHV